MNKFLLTLIVSSIAIFTAACGDDSSSSQASSAEVTPTEDEQSGDTTAIDTATSAIDWKEIPHSCKVTLKGDSVQIITEFQNWSWNEIDVIDSDTTHITQTFTGISSDDFDTFCDLEKDDGEATNIVCSENSITSDIPTGNVEASDVQAWYDEICHHLLTGSITIENFFLEN